MENAQKLFYQSFIDTLKKWMENKKKEGFIPSIELLIEDLESIIEKNENHF